MFLVLNGTTTDTFKQSTRFGFHQEAFVYISKQYFKVENFSLI